MNKKGFTLTEVLAVIAIIAIVSLVAIPNIVNISDNVKRDNMLNDAKKFISLAKLEVNSDYDIRTFAKSGTCSSGTKCTFKINDLNKNGDFKTEDFNGTRKIVDVDGLGYDNSKSSVKYYKSGNEVKYCIYLVSEKRYLGPANITKFTNCSETNCCIDEELLSSKDVVHVK